MIEEEGGPFRSRAEVLQTLPGESGVTRACLRFIDSGAASQVRRILSQAAANRHKSDHLCGPKRRVFKEKLWMLHSQVESDKINYRKVEAAKGKRYIAAGVTWESLRPNC